MKQLRSFQEFGALLKDFIRESDPARFDELALNLFELQFEHVPAYRKLCERVLRGGKPKTWSDIPAVPTTAFKDFDLTSIPVTERTHVFHSSGTTEQRPSRHFHHHESLSIYEASLIRWFEEKFEPSNAQFVSLTPPPALAPHSSLVHMFGTIAKSHETVFTGTIGNDKTWHINADETVAVLEGFSKRSEPVAVVGTAFNFVHLIDHLAENNLRLHLPKGSRVMETGGYKGRSRSIPKTELHELISNNLGIPNSEITSEYGMSELSSQAYNIPDGVFRFPPWARTQIISPDTSKEVAVGETGLLRIYDLANVYSVMAIQTEDLAIRRADGFELIGRATDAEPRGCSLMATEAVVR